MTNKSWVDRQNSAPEARREYERERLAVWTFECIAEAMETNGQTKADIARSLGTSRANITQLLSGERNPTLRTVADLAWACGSRLTIGVEPLRDGEYITSPVVLVQTRRCVTTVEQEGSADSAERTTELAA